MHICARVVIVRLYRKPQSVGGALRGFDYNVHPEVESLSLRRMFHRLLLKPLDQLQVLHNGAQIPGRKYNLTKSEISLCFLVHFFQTNTSGVGCCNITIRHIALTYKKKLETLSYNYR